MIEKIYSLSQSPSMDSAKAGGVLKRSLANLWGSIFNSSTPPPCPKQLAERVQELTHVKERICQVQALSGQHHALFNRLARSLKDNVQFFQSMLHKRQDANLGEHYAEWIDQTKKLLGRLDQNQQHHSLVHETASHILHSAFVKTCFELVDVQKLMLQEYPREDGEHLVQTMLHTFQEMYTTSSEKLKDKSNLTLQHVDSIVYKLKKKMHRIKPESGFMKAKNSKRDAEEVIVLSSVSKARIAPTT